MKEAIYSFITNYYGWFLFFMLVASLFLLMLLIGVYLIKNSLEESDADNSYIFQTVPGALLDEDLIYDSFDVQGIAVYARTEDGVIHCGSVVAVRIESGIVTLEFTFKGNESSQIIRKDYEAEQYKVCPEYLYHFGGRCINSITLLMLEKL